jgi:anthranilate phosphoribosyltransferase
LKNGINFIPLYFGEISNPSYSFPFFMKKILENLFQSKSLSREEAREVLVNISEGKYNESQIAAFITVYLMRSIRVEELTGFRDALLDLCIPFDTEGCSTIDVCGTGGDGKNTFNISTLSAFVLAGAGYKVAKHGNYGVSSISGSSNVLEHFGYQFTNDKSLLMNQLDKHNICFLHAPLFHPALKTVAPIRKQLGVKTFFNMLGPLVNPAQPQQQMVGVFSLELARLYQYIFQKTAKNYAIIHGLAGYDEVSLTDDVKVKTAHSERILTAADFGKKQLSQEQIFGGDTVQEAATIFLNVLENKGTSAQRDVVLANTALAIQCYQPSASLLDCMAEAKESLESGKALIRFKGILS